MFLVIFGCSTLLNTIIEVSVHLQCGFFIIVLDLRLTKLVRGCRETAFNFLYTFQFFPSPY